MKQPALSIIIPAYNQEKTIKKDIDNIKTALDTLSATYEIIVVDDGSTDKTYDQIRSLRSSHVYIYNYDKNKGKGYAVRYGMFQARGDIVAFIDAGMDLNPNGISILLDYFKWYDADIIVGSKLHPLSKIHYPVSRKILSWGYRTLVHILFGLSIKDTQVGIKLFRRDVIKNVLPRLLVEDFAFDIEILAVAYYLGYKKIFEAPIELDFTGVSTITSKGFWKTVFFMLVDTFQVFYRLKILHYYDDSNKKNWNS